MKFWEAMREMQENGKKVRCKDWSYGAYVGDDSISGFSWTYLEQDWELYKEPEKFYSWLEVVRGLKEGKKFKRNHWYGIHIENRKVDKEEDFNGGICFIANDMIAFHVGFSTEDFEAYDWMECK